MWGSKLLGPGSSDFASAAPYEESWENMGHGSLLLRAAGLEALGGPLIIDLYKKLLVPLASQVAVVVRICLQCRRCGFNAYVRKMPWRRPSEPTPVFLPGESHGQRSLAGHGPRGRTELDAAEPANTSACP